MYIYIYIHTNVATYFPASVYACVCADITYQWIWGDQYSIYSIVKSYRDSNTVRRRDYFLVGMRSFFAIIIAITQTPLRTLYSKKREYIYIYIYIYNIYIYIYIRLTTAYTLWLPMR